MIHPSFFSGTFFILFSSPFYSSPLLYSSSPTCSVFLSHLVASCPRLSHLVKLAYSLTSNFPKATRVINEADVFDREGCGWGYEEFFPLSLAEFKDQLKSAPLIITSQVSLLE